MGKSKIEWTQHSWNPLKVRSGGPFGCTKKSAGCLNCYAGRLNRRIWGGLDYDYIHEPTDFYLDEKVLQEPLRRKTPTTYFVCSMCDLFHENVPDDMIISVLNIIERAGIPPGYAQKTWKTQFDAHGDYLPHRFILLTKRPDRMAKLMERFHNQFSHQGVAAVFDHVWLGVTAENQEMADKRIPILLETPAAVRFVSVEPMLGPVDLTNINDVTATGDREHPIQIINNVKKLDWVICGGESGPGARPVHPDWVRSLRDQCVAADVPFFFKQWGEYADYFSTEIPDSVLFKKQRFVFLDEGGAQGQDIRTQMYRVGKKAAGRLLDGKVWDQMPERKA